MRVRTTLTTGPRTWLVHARGAQWLRRAWVAVAVMIAVTGVVASLYGAQATADRETSRAHEEFEAASSDVAVGLRLALQHEQDLIISAGAFIAGRPAVTNVEFQQWASTVRASARYPELRGLGVLAMVPADELEAYAAQAEADPIPSSFPSGPFSVTPPGDRPFYCFARSVGYASPGSPSVPGAFDLCSIRKISDALLSARDTGEGSYLPGNVVPGLKFLLVSTPVYAGGTVPATVDERRSSFIGAIGTQIDATVLLDTALTGHPSMTAELRYVDGPSDVTFTSGVAGPNAAVSTVDLGNGWMLEASRVLSGGALTSGTPLRLLLVGIATGVLLAMLVYVLGTSRARAISLVDAKTDELRHQALHDALTGLPNRDLIMDRMEQLLARNRRSGVSGMAMFVDLDEFKNVNDTLGHEAGDRLLRAVAVRLAGTLREADTIGRMGGDEFVVLIDGSSMQSSPELVAERLLEVMHRPFEFESGEMPLRVTLSIGIAVGDRPTAGELLRDADVALYQAKAAGKNCYKVFYPEMQAVIRHRVQLEFDLRSALDGGQYRLVYQPIYNLDDLALVGVEALLRWDHPVEGIVQPDSFIPILEQTGGIIDVGGWVLSEACRQMATWQTSDQRLGVSVNVSARQLDSDAVVHQVRRALADSGIEPSSLTIEVTETALMRNPTATARRLGAIKELGVQIAVDDFGTGYSSLAYLQQFPVDSLKIDRAFTNGITTSPESRALVSTLVQLGRDLGLKTLAEGVETIEQVDQLRDQRVDEAQGFLLARPLPPETFESTILHPSSTTATEDR